MTEDTETQVKAKDKATAGRKDSRSCWGKAMEIGTMEMAKVQEHFPVEKGTRGRLGVLEADQKSKVDPDLDLEPGIGSI